MAKGQTRQMTKAQIFEGLVSQAKELALQYSKL